MLPALFLPNHFQQLLPKALWPPAPPTPQFLPVPGRLAQFESLALLHCSLKLPPSPATITSDAPFAHDPIHPQPRRPFAWTLQVLRPTAPLIGFEGLLRLQQLRAHRIQMHVITDRLQIARAAAIHHQRLVASTEQMAKQFMTPVEARGVSA